MRVIGIYPITLESNTGEMHKLGDIDETEMPYECSGGDMITGGILCRYIRKKYL